MQILISQFGPNLQVAACFVLGASGVALGTRFVATQESSYKDAKKQLIVQTGSQASDRQAVQCIICHPLGQACKSLLPIWVFIAGGSMLCAGSIRRSAGDPLGGATQESLYKDAKKQLIVQTGSQASERPATLRTTLYDELNEDVRWPDGITGRAITNDFTGQWDGQTPLQASAFGTSIGKCTQNSLLFSHPGLMQGAA